MNIPEEILIKILNIAMVCGVVILVFRYKFFSDFPKRATCMASTIVALINLFLAYFLGIPFVLVFGGSMAIEDTINASILFAGFFGILTLILIILKK